MKNLTGLLASLVMIFVVLACSSGDETSKANNAVHEANKFMTIANESVVKASAKYEEYEAKVAAITNDKGLEAARAVGKELMTLQSAMSENFTKAGEKFDEGSKMKIKDAHRQYLETKAKEKKLRGEYSAELKKIPQALMDSSNEKEYQETVNALLEKIDKMTDEAKALAEKAKKIQTDNPDVMEQPA